MLHCFVRVILETFPELNQHLLQSQHLSFLPLILPSLTEHSVLLCGTSVELQPSSRLGVFEGLERRLNFTSSSSHSKSLCGRRWCTCMCSVFISFSFLSYRHGESRGSFWHHLSLLKLWKVGIVRGKSLTSQRFEIVV
ncbi:uncharacterized protein LOC129293478 [Prosopis cineraria]|uniref:uncharacterized protein LOC129293478 n=1 Tax=Prosopis cineraria TaxID=364024 RepID=UPI00240F91D6|nr:uncharacterized protein LOC129293478 [Prosopis cineraria]